jgi:hypothetical protein
MPITARHRRIESQQPELFLPPTTCPTWDQLPEPCRQEVQWLVARMLIAHAAADLWIPQEKEDDHE